MTNKIKNAIKYGSALATVLAVSPAAALAEDIDLKGGLNSQWTPITTITTNGALSFVINAILIVAGITSFLFLLIGGVQWILAGGDKEGTEKSRKKITSALVGLAIVFSAYALAALVNTVFKVNILQFTIPTIVP